MKQLGALVVLAALAGCATAPKLACPDGEAQVRTAQLFVGTPASPVSDAEVRRFVDREVTPRFPDGVTIVDGGRQWTGDENRLIREASKVVLIVLPPKSSDRVEAVRRAARVHFRHPPVLVAPPPSCAAI